MLLYHKNHHNFLESPLMYFQNLHLYRSVMSLGKKMEIVKGWTVPMDVTDDGDDNVNGE